jgi:hypothetical protein
VDKFVASLGSRGVGEKKEEKYSYKKRVESTSGHVIPSFKVLDIFVTEIQFNKEAVEAIHVLRKVLNRYSTTFG